MIGWKKIGEIEFYNLILNKDYQSQYLVEILHGLFDVKFYSLLAVVWNDLPESLKDEIKAKLVRETVNLRNFQYLIDIVCKISFEVTDPFIEVFSFVRRSPKIGNIATLQGTDGC
jgi:hypothetical protein